MTYSLKEIEKYSIIGWMVNNAIKNEKGDLIDFIDHPYLYDIYRDTAQNLCVIKAAQVGLSTAEIIKNHYDARCKKMDIIYTLPTDSDVNIFVGGKVNRIIANNPCMLVDTKDKDSIEQKQVGSSMIYFRGSWTKKAAIMVTADRLCHDEKDSSKADVIADYQARLQHSKFKQTHVFSHPSVKGFGVDVEWAQSDMKEWFVQCPHCQKWQYLSWNTELPGRMSVDLERKEFVCKKCFGILDKEVRRNGHWRKKKGKEGAKFSGYHVSLLMAVWISAADICEKWNDVVDGKQTEEYFYNKILGLPYSGAGNTVNEETIKSLITTEKNNYGGRIVIGVDTGVKLRYVVGNKLGLMGYGEMTDYMPDDANGLALNQTLEYFLTKFENSVMVIDQGGDIIGARKLRAKYPGRVFLCHYRRDRKAMQLITWGEGDEFGNVTVDRNRMMQLVIDEATELRWRLYNGTWNDWYDFYLHWSHIYRTAEEDKTTQKPIFVWHRSDRDDYVHACCYWRIGVDRFGTGGGVDLPGGELKPNSYFVHPDQTADFDPGTMFNIKGPGEDPEEDWRNI
jgi:hypothetical protein